MTVVQPVAEFPVPCYLVEVDPTIGSHNNFRVLVVMGVKELNIPGISVASRILDF